MHKSVVDMPIGSKFAGWTVIGPYSCVKHGAYYWPCRCECGAEDSINGAHLRGGATSRCRSCAAVIRKEYEDLVGEQYGKWTVASRIPLSERTSVNISWLCRCECGGQRAMSVTEVKGSTGGCWNCRDTSRPTVRKRPYESTYNAAAKHAGLRGLDFSISYEDFLREVGTGRCHYCYVSVEWTKFGESKAYRNHHLDRKDNALGYVAGNVCACCARCNYAKGNRFTYEEWLGMTEYFRRTSTNNS